MIYSTERICQAALAEVQVYSAVTKADLVFDKVGVLEAVRVGPHWVSAEAVWDRLEGRAELEQAPPSPTAQRLAGIAEIIREGCYEDMEAQAFGAIEAGVKALRECIGICAAEPSADGR